MVNLKQHTTVTWVARIASVAALLFIGTFVVGEFASGQGQLPARSEWPGFLCFPIGLSVGLVMGWWKELPGGLTTILSIVAFYAWHFTRSGTWPSGPWFLLLAAPGVLFVIAAATRHRGTDGFTPTEHSPHSTPA